MKISGREKQTISARCAAFLALRQIERDDAYANIAFKQVLNQYKLSSQEARLAAQITYGSTRMRLALDHMLSHFLKKPLDELMMELKIILRLSLFQLHYLETEPYAAVNEGVALTKKYASPKLAGLTNAVLRNYLRADKASLLPAKDDDFREYLNVTLSFPVWLVDYLLAHYTPEEAEAFCIHANTHRGIAIRANTLKISADDLAQALAAENIQTSSAGYAPETLRLTGEAGNLAAQHFFRDGYFIVQGLSSQLVAHALSPAPGSRVLDLCAAPGGKTTHLAQKMENRGEIYASDLYDHKVALIYENAARLGIDIIHAEQKDGAMWGRECPDRFDAVLLDAPCSGLGVLNRRSDSRLRKEPEDILSLAAIQKELLISAHKALKPGGRMVYSTCTLSLEENQKQVQWFLSEFPDMKRQAFDDRIPGLNESEKAQAALGTLELLPYAHQTDGFFISCFKKDTE